MGRTRTQIGHNSVPLAGPFGAALPVGHHVHLEFHLQVVGHVLHQVDRVAVAARQVVETALVLLGALVVAENAGQLVLLAGGYAQARHARQATLFLFFLVVFLEHFRLHHERRREDGRHPVDSTTVRTRSSKSSAGPLNSCNKKKKKKEFIIISRVFDRQFGWRRKGRTWPRADTHSSKVPSLPVIFLMAGS